MARPTKYSPDIAKKAKEYLDDKIAKNDLPYIEELAVSMDIDMDTLKRWEGKHKVLRNVLKRLRNYQSFKLQKGSVVGKYNPASAIFQLKANHGMIETERKMLVGANNGPITVETVSYDEDKNPV